MAVDLRSATMFQRISLVLMDDAIIKLEHERTQDRVRRFPYESIQTVIIWRKVSWWRIIFCGIFLVLPGIGLLFFNSAPTTVTGAIVAGLGVALICWYAYCKVTTIRIVRAGANYDLKGLFRPGKLRKFRQRLLPEIAAVQAAFIPAEPLPTLTETPPPAKEPAHEAPEIHA